MRQGNTSSTGFGACPTGNPAREHALSHHEHRRLHERLGSVRGRPHRLLRRGRLLPGEELRGLLVPLRLQPGHPLAKRRGTRPVGRPGKPPPPGRPVSLRRPSDGAGCSPTLHGSGRSCSGAARLDSRSVSRSSSSPPISWSGTTARRSQSLRAGCASGDSPRNRGLARAPCLRLRVDEAVHDRPGRGRPASDHLLARASASTGAAGGPRTRLTVDWPGANRGRA